MRAEKRNHKRRRADRSCFAGYLKLGKGSRSGYTRKGFQFLIFTSIVIIRFLRGMPSVCLFGGICSPFIFFAIRKGEGNIAP